MVENNDNGQGVRAKYGSFRKNASTPENIIKQCPLSKKGRKNITL
jgi:hypothetical protein